MPGDDSVTLGQGLQAFREKNREYLSHDEDWVSSEARAFFESHDVAHVLFDCDVSLLGEGAVKIWTIFGTDIGFWRHVKEYREASAFALSTHFGWMHAMGNTIKLLPSIPLIIARAKRMSKPWPWMGFGRYLNTPICEIRKEYNIDVLKYGHSKRSPRR